MPDGKKNGGSPRAKLSALLGIPQAGAVPWDQPWKLHNPENIRPRPDNPRSGRSDVRVFARYGPGFEPQTAMYPGHMGLEFALLNGFRQDTLSGLFGEPEGGVSVYSDEEGPIGLDQFVYEEDPDSDAIWPIPFKYTHRRGRKGGDEIVIQQGTMNEGKFAEGLTHEYVHRAHAQGLPRSDEDNEQLEMTQRLRRLSEQFGEEPMANAISYALEAIRQTPEGSRDFHTEVASVQRAGTHPDYVVTPEAADSATAWIYALLGRE